MDDEDDISGRSEVSDVTSDSEESDWDSETDEDDNIYEEPNRTIVPVNFVTRSEWGAEAGGDQNHFTLPVEDVIYSYTETDTCKTRDECIASMKQMQQFHIKEGLPDIKFNFVVGGDGYIYEGTGWKVRAPANKHYPTLGGKHIELAHSGKRGDFPEKEKVDLINSLFDYGVEKKYLSDDCRTYIDYLWPTD